MRTQRSKIRSGALSLAVVFGSALAIPLAASAGPLLSGYGGPGQGNQAILGSTLIGGPGGGSGGSGGSGGRPETASAAQSAATNAAANGQTAPGASRTGATSGSATRGAQRGSGTANAATGAGRPLGGELSDRAYRGLESAGGSSALGLSAAEIIYIVLAAAALAFTGVLTRRLAGARTAKGHS